MVIVQDEEWLVTKVESATDGYFIDVVGLSELVRDTEATFSTGIDDIVEADPTTVSVVADDSPSTGGPGSGWRPCCARRRSRSPTRA